MSRTKSQLCVFLKILHFSCLTERLQRVWKKLLNWILFMLKVGSLKDNVTRKYIFWACFSLWLRGHIVSIVNDLADTLQNSQ